MMHETACADFQAPLQDYLDGISLDLAPAAEAHRRICISCGRDFAAAILLRQSVGRVPAFAPSPELTARMVSAILNDQPSVSKPRTMRSAIYALATAACLLLAVALGMRLIKNRTNPELPGTQVVTQPSPISVDATLAEAGAALNSLTRRTANSAMEPTKTLVPTPPSLDLTGAPLANSMDPAAHSLAEIRQGVSSGFAPMTRTARRAFEVFLRDAPVSVDRKPVSSNE